MQARSRGRLRGGMAWAMVAALALSACSPQLNWRRADLDGPGQALFPCRPDHRVREGVMLGGERFTMWQSACEAGGMTFAVTSLRLPPARPGGPSPDGLMDELARSTASNIGAVWRPALAAAPAPASAPASSPLSSRRVRLDGRRSDGQAVGVELALRVRDGWLLQAAVVGPAPERAAAEAFFEGLDGRL